MKSELEKQEYYCLSTVVNEMLRNEKNGIKSAAELAKASSQNKSTISRMLRDDNGKGTTYRPKPETIMAICVAFKLDKAETISLFNTAFPEFLVWREIIANRLDIIEANEALYDKGLPILGGAAKDEV